MAHPTLNMPLILALWFSCIVVTSSASRSFGSVASEVSLQDNSGGQKLWCVAKPAAPDYMLNANLNFACGEGGADCSKLQPGSTCFSPNTAIAHASFAMNMYYQGHGRNWWNCYFNNTGLVVFTDPSFGNCVYPAQ